MNNLAISTPAAYMTHIKVDCVVHLWLYVIEPPVYSRVLSERG